MEFRLLTSWKAEFIKKKFNSVCIYYDKYGIIINKLFIALDETLFFQNPELIILIFYVNMWTRPCEI